MELASLQPSWIPIFDAFLETNRILPGSAWTELKRAIRDGEIAAHCKVKGRDVKLQPCWLDYTLLWGNKAPPPQLVSTTDCPEDNMLWFEAGASSPKGMPGCASNIVLNRGKFRFWLDEANALLEREAAAQKRQSLQNNRRTHSPTPNDEAAFKIWMDPYSKRREAPTSAEIEAWAAERCINRDYARKWLKKEFPHLERSRGRPRKSPAN